MSLKASVKYNIPVPEKAPAFEVEVSVHRRKATNEEEITACYPLQLKITAKYVSIRICLHYPTFPGRDERRVGFDVLLK